MRDYIVVEGALIKCEYGTVNATFLEVEDHGCTIDDKIPVLDNNMNIGSFVFCSLYKKACTFKNLEPLWRNPACSGVVNEGHYLTTKSVMFCEERGMLSIIDAGQDCMFEDSGILKFTID